MDGDVFYPATISNFDPEQNPLNHLLTYDDGDREWCDLSNLEWRKEAEPDNDPQNSMMYPSGGEPSELMTSQPPSQPQSQPLSQSQTNTMEQTQAASLRV